MHTRSQSSNADFGSPQAACIVELSASFSQEVQGMTGLRGVRSEPRTPHLGHHQRIGPRAAGQRISLRPSLAALTEEVSVTSIDGSVRERLLSPTMATIHLAQ